MKFRKQVVMSESKRKKFTLNAKALAYYREHPCIACEELLGIKLIDAQKIILQASWNTPNCLWVCTRDFGKSFLGSIFILLRAILYENQKIYIVSSKGSQAKETFGKIEEIVLGIGKTADSIASLKDIVRNETVKSPMNKTGFAKPPEGYWVKFYNGSSIHTLNSRPSNARSRRATLVFFDEAAFCDEELITACEPFTAQDSNFKTSTDTNYNPECEKLKCPNQIIYASSQDSMDTLFYKKYKQFSKEMIAGNRDYYVCDMICDVAIEVYTDGKKQGSLLTRAKVEGEVAINREKGLREYYNIPSQDGGDNQIVKRGLIKRNENLTLPEIVRNDKAHYVFAFDPARTTDNSILTVMKICCDKEIGYYGQIVNCLNFVDYINKHGYKLDSNRQLERLRANLLAYNGKAPDYEYIDALLIDAGAGGGGVSTYADGLLNEWTDSAGNTHKGLIDLNDKRYEGYDDLYPDNSDILTLIDPNKMRTQMVSEMLDIIKLDLIKFPYDYNGNGAVKIYTEHVHRETMEDGSIKKSIEEDVTEHVLSWEEEEALININALKSEITAIHKYSNSENTKTTYALPKDKEKKMHDDRFYTFIMLAHYLYKLRRCETVENVSTDEYDFVPLCS